MEDQPKYKRTSFVIPEFLEEYIKELVEDCEYLRNHSTKSELLWKIVNLAAMYVRGDSIDRAGDTFLDDEIRDYLEQASNNRRKSVSLRERENTAARQKDDREIRKRIRAILKKYDRPLNFAELYEQIDMPVGRKRLRRILEENQNKKTTWVIFDPGVVGQALQIALIGTEAEEVVQELIREQEKERKAEEKRKRVRRRRRKKKKSVGE